MAHVESNAEQIKELGWRQGAILPQSLVDERRLKLQLPDHCFGANQSGKSKPSPGWVKWFRSHLGLPQTSQRQMMADIVLVAVTHDCDITHPSFEREPFVELIVGKLLPDSQQDGNKEWGKNSRLLNTEAPGYFSGFKYIQFDATSRFSAPRFLLAKHKPSEAKLPSAAIHLLAGWLAKRFARRGFPDTFNARTATATDKLRKPFKTKGHLLTGVYILVSDDELDDDYEIMVWATMSNQHFEDTNRRREAMSLLDQVEEKLDACHGISVIESELRSEDDFSLTDLRLMKRWDFDDLTAREQRD